MMHQLVPLQQAASILGYKDRRSAEEWCKARGVYIKSDKKRKYVFEKAIEFALEQEFIKDLEKNHPSNFEEIYKMIKNNDMLEAYKITNKYSESSNNHFRTRYIPQSSLAKKYSKK